MSPGRRSMLLMMAFVVVWTVVELIAAGVLARFSPYQVVWTRYVVHLLVMVLIFGWHKPQRLWRTGRPTYQFARSMMMVGMPASWIVATQAGVDSATIMTIFWISPLLILALARVLLGEVAHPLIWILSLVGWGSAYLVFGGGRLAYAPALLLLPLGMALSFSLYVVMTRSLRSETTVANLFYSALGVALVLTPFMPGVWIIPTAQDLLIMVAVGVLGLLTLLALDRMAAAAPVSRAAPLVYLQIPIAVACHAGLSHQFPGRRIGLGVSLILVCALFVWLRESRLTVQDKRSAVPPSPRERLSGV